MLAVAGAAASVVAAAAFTGAAGSVAVAPCTRDVSTVAAIVVGCVRHIPSQAARVVPDMDMPVVLVVRWPVTRDGTIADMDTVRRRWELQRLMAPTALTTTATMRTAIGSVPISTNIDAHRAHPTAAGSALTPSLSLPLVRRAGHAAN
ncbi:hypothetical protein CQ10_34025 [Bradyrhizobium valentinum]|nr:hypothetical protein CQ10_34025 [Bradyrhizobium valentinum]